MPSGKLFRRILIYEYLGFGVMIFALWVNELFDIPNRFFGGDATPVNFIESTFETIILLLLACGVIRATMVLLNQIEELAMFDPLTKLMNRGFFKELLQREINRSARFQRPFSMIMGDVDHFKRVNDEHGHDCGDKVLQHIARILQKNLRSEDVICRWGGEEFLFLLPETSLDEAGEVAEKLRSKIEGSPLTFNNIKVPITMSFGVCAQTPGDRNISSCIASADRRLYEAKRNGRNQVVPSPFAGAVPAEANL